MHLTQEKFRRLINLVVSGGDIYAIQKSFDLPEDWPGILQANRDDEIDEGHLVLQSLKKVGVEVLP